MSTLLAGGVGPRERADIEAHATRCARCGTALRDMVAMSVALDRAYAPLRARSASLSPARVRLAMRVVQPIPVATRFSRITARITEFGLAAAVTAFAFVGSASVARLAGSKREPENKPGPQQVRHRRCLAFR